MNVLKVTPEEVNDKAKDINTLGENMSESMKTLLTQLSSLMESDWTGAASAAYCSKCTELVTQVNGALERISSYANKLSEAAARYQEAELKNIEENNQLSAGSTFASM